MASRGKEVGLLAVHGMGEQTPDFAGAFFSLMEKHLGEELFARVHFEPVFYQAVLDEQQSAMAVRMERETLRWQELRRFTMFSLSDAVSLTRRPDTPQSPYTRVQRVVQESIGRCERALDGPDRPMVIVAHSLGGHVISNYLWDSQQEQPCQGVWCDVTRGDSPVEACLRLHTLKALFTLGCNIPVFVAGYREQEIIPVHNRSHGYDFVWRNFYDPDDVLGWPLQPINPAYGRTVEDDVVVNAAGSALEAATKGWNPLSHSLYWRDRGVIEPVADTVRALLLGGSSRA